MTGGGGAGSEMGGRGTVFGGLLGWIFVVCVVVIDSSSVGFGISRRDGSGLSVIGLTLGVVGTWLGVACDVAV